MNNSGITKVSLNNAKQILFNVQMQVSVSAMVSNVGVTADTNGRKIIKAGTPLEGVLDTRETVALKKTATAANTTCVALHDVDVTSGNANVAVLIWGFVNLNRLESDVQAMISADVKTALNGKITFLKG